MIASFQDQDPGMDHQDQMPQGIARPEDLPSAAELLGQFDHPVTNYWSKARPFDLRHATEPIYLQPAKENLPEQMIWFRALSELPEDRKIQTAALAYASDYSILESILRRHGISWAHKGLNSASLDHAMWFHRSARVDQWLLYVQQSPSAQNGRGLSLGKIFTRDGLLVATVAQEGMVRIPEVS
jgi:acyl-CoA thioesterase-2